MNVLPFRIVHMIRRRHRRAHADIDRYSGISASEMDWRYRIGRLRNDRGPRISLPGAPARQAKPIGRRTPRQQLADDFEAFHCNTRTSGRVASSAYSRKSCSCVMPMIPRRTQTGCKTRSVTFFPLTDPRIG